MIRRIGRTILAIVLGLSVALLPATAGFAASAGTMEMSAATAMPDCDHQHGTPCDTTQQTTHSCADMTACAINCFNFTATACSDIIFASSAGATLKLAPTADQLPTRTVGAPFRPPRA